MVAGVVDSANDSGSWRVVASSGDECRGVASRGKWWQVVACCVCRVGVGWMWSVRVVGVRWVWVGCGLGVE